MRIDLERVRDEPFTWSVEESIAAEELGRSELLDLGSIAWSGRVDETTSGFLLSARLEYDQTLACTRCLAPVTEPVESDITLLVEVETALPLPGEHELEEADLEVLKLEEPELDTDPILREHLQLNIPMRMLCREECAGLCPQCGVNRNERECDCEAPSDPRWEPLQRIKEQLAKEN